MAPIERLSRKSKGKANASECVSVGLDETTGEALEDLRHIHQDALTDVAGLNTPQRVLVADHERLLRGDDDGNESSDDPSGKSSDDPSGESSSSPSPVEYRENTPIKFHHSGLVERLPQIATESLRGVEASDPRIENVEATWSTVGSETKLLRECGANGVTFIIPSAEQRPWSPPIGYECVYESYFGGDTKLWFPIPRLITSYVKRRKAALSQFVNGSWRVAVALMVMAAEVDVSMSVRTFEELCLVKQL